MAKKKINIILIVVVLALWGTVGYRALNRQFSGSDITTEKQNQLDNVTIKQIIKDTFKLEKINRDPFLNQQFQTIVTTPRKIVSTSYRATKKIVVTSTPKIDPMLRWPMLSYYGYIASQERNEDLVLLKIDSKLCRLKLNNPVNGVMIKKRYKDSIEVYFNSQSRIIRKQ